MAVATALVVCAIAADGGTTLHDCQISGAELLNCMLPLCILLLLLLLAYSVQHQRYKDSDTVSECCVILAFP